MGGFLKRFGWLQRTHEVPPEIKTPSHLNRVALRIFDDEFRSDHTISRIRKVGGIDWRSYILLDREGRWLAEVRQNHGDDRILRVRLEKVG